VTLEDYRRFYAEEVIISAQISSPRLFAALASVPREKFAGPGPWRLGAISGLGSLTYMTSPNAAARHVYHNTLIALDEARWINMGHPGTLASWISALELKPGDRVFHLGAGVGYYTALMAHMVGADGHVVAWEADPALATRAAENLREYANVELHFGDGVSAEFDPVDAMFINAGVTHPRREWLTLLRSHGRMIVPLTVDVDASVGRGVMMKVSGTQQSLAAIPIGFAMIYHCTNGRDPKAEAALAKSLDDGSLLQVRSARLEAHEPDSMCVVHAGSVCFSRIGPTD
jgi:protein-L-isoaspartate(D-aspartate) O-methyltransferase